MIVWSYGQSRGRGLWIERIITEFCGVRPGSTRTEIDKAYNERMKRLRSLDFEDEREYADRKMRELKYAYSVVVGGAPPVSARHQKREHHKQRKDDMESEEMTGGFFREPQRTGKSRRGACKAKRAKRNRTSPGGQPQPSKR